MIDPQNFPGRGQVAILRTHPETVLDDYARLMRLARYTENLPKDQDTLLKINISWQIWYPSCSTTPWQLEGVLRTLLADGYARDKIIATHNDTVVVNGREGQINNRHKFVQDKYGLKIAETYSPDRPINPGYGSRALFIAASAGTAAGVLAFALGFAVESASANQKRINTFHAHRCVPARIIRWRRYFATPSLPAATD